MENAKNNIICLAMENNSISENFEEEQKNVRHLHYQISVISRGWLRNGREFFNYLLILFIILVIWDVTVLWQRRRPCSLVLSLFPHLGENSCVVVWWCGVPVVPFTKFWNRNFFVLWLVCNHFSSVSIMNKEI